MQNQFSRTQLLLGKPALDTLSGSRVAVFGLGGVGGHTVEVLARSGVGALDVFDDDRICPSNLNRQLLALHSTVGQYKTDVAAERIHDINPGCIVRRHRIFYLPQNAADIDLSVYDYVVDCIDTVAAKIELIRRCHALGVPLISSMGAANKLDATAFRVSDISKTTVDPLAKVIRKKLRKLNINHLKVVYSEEAPLLPLEDIAPGTPEGDSDSEQDTSRQTKRHGPPASNAFVPAAAGLIVGGEVVKDLINRAGTMRIPPGEEARNAAAVQATEHARAHLQHLREYQQQEKNEKTDGVQANEEYQP